MNIGRPTHAWHAAAVAAATLLSSAVIGCGGDVSEVFGNDGDGTGGGTTSGGPGGTASGPGGTTTATGATGTSATTSTGGPTSTASSTGPGGGGGDPVCDSGPDEDADGDGFSPNAGDCNDCNADQSPNASEVAGNGSDDDCDGLVDEGGACDAGLPINGDPLLAAQAIGICTTVANDGDGIVDARWIRAGGGQGVPGFQGGILDDFGPNVPPLEGDKVLALSSGHARLPSQEGACGTDSCQIGPGFAPSGFPQSAPDCPPADVAINDDIGLEVTLRAPENATGYRYRFRFYSFEFPAWVCTAFTDQFVVLASPAPPGSVNGNLSVQGALPLSVNVPIDACSSCVPWAENCATEELTNPDVDCPPIPNPCCPEGPSALSGTGFDQWATGGAGATTWLETRAPVTGGDEITLQFLIWDTGDMALDSTVVIDDFAWLSEDGVVLRTAPVE